MPATDSARLLLVADPPRTPAPAADGKVRRYRLGRLRQDAARREAEPRYAYLKRTYD